MVALLAMVVAAQLAEVQAAVLFVGIHLHPLLDGHPSAIIAAAQAVLVVLVAITTVRVEHPMQGGRKCKDSNQQPYQLKDGVLGVLGFVFFLIKKN